MHPIFGVSLMNGTKGLVLGAFGLAVVSTMSLGSLALPGRQEAQPPLHSSLDPVSDRTSSTLHQALSDLRRAAMAELEKALGDQSRSMEPQSLLVASYEEGGLIAGATVTGASGSVDPGAGGNGAIERSEKEQAQASIGDDTVGVVVLAHSAPTLRSAETPGPTVGIEAKEAASADEIASGTYLVRWSEDQSSLELVAADGKVAATIPVHGATETERPTVSEREDDEGDELPLTESSERAAVEKTNAGARSQAGSNGWPDLFMAILHWLDPRFRS